MMLKGMVTMKNMLGDSNNAFCVKNEFNLVSCKHK